MSKFIISVQPTIHTLKTQPQKVYSQIMLVNKIYYIYLHVKSGVVCPTATPLECHWFEYRGRRRPPTAAILEPGYPVFIIIVNLQVAIVNFQLLYYYSTAVAF